MSSSSSTGNDRLLFRGLSNVQPSINLKTHYASYSTKQYHELHQFQVGNIKKSIPWPTINQKPNKHHADVYAHKITVETSTQYKITNYSIWPLASEPSNNMIKCTCNWLSIRDANKTTLGPSP